MNIAVPLSKDFTSFGDQINKLAITNERVKNNLHILLESIHQVGLQFFEYTIDSPQNDSDFEFKTHVERCFAYELYRQWNNLLQYHDSKLTVNSEIQKKIWSDIHTAAKSAKYKYPDFLLHASQEDNSDCNQIFVVELKKSDAQDNKIREDFEKFITLMGADENNSFSSPFGYCVFIQLSENFASIKNALIDIASSFQKTKEHVLVDDSTAELMDRIICIRYYPHKGTDVPIVQTLRNVLYNS